MKRKARSLKLSRETLRRLESGEARRAAAAASDVGTNCAGLCVTMHPANCPHTRFCPVGTEFCPPPTNPDCNYLTVGPCGASAEGFC